MYCSNCGKENVSGSNFCAYCGNRMNIQTNNNIEEKGSGNKETSLVLGIICLVSSFFINVLCFIPGIISIVYAKKYKKESGKLGVGFGLSLGGMIFSFIILFLTILLFVFIFAMINETNNEGDYKYNYNTEYTYNLPNI